LFLSFLFIFSKVGQEHADPFLKPVTDEEADGYSTIITNPMDLQTMTEKILHKDYFSVEQFKTDLDLIWANCFTFNPEV
jgi:transcriptional activator SPT7